MKDSIYKFCEVLGYAIGKAIRLFLNLLAVAAVVFILWFLISFFDVILHNGMENPTYLSWNLLGILMRLR